MIKHNYAEFIMLYMEKDENNHWRRKKDMWTKDDKDDWTPNKPKR